MKNESRKCRWSNHIDQPITYSPPTLLSYPTSSQHLKQFFFFFLDEVSSASLSYCTNHEQGPPRLYELHLK